MITCTPEVEVLAAQNVFYSQDTPTFSKPQNVFTLCLANSDPFGTFCLLPPDEGHMPLMCDVGPRPLFASALDAQIDQLSQLPRAISYPNLHTTDVYVPTSVFPTLPAMPVLLDFGSSDDSNTNVAIRADTDRLMLQAPDGLMRNQATPSGAQNSLATSVINGAGTVRGVMYSDTGPYVATTASAGVFVALQIPGNVPPQRTHAAFFIRDNNVGDTFFALATEVNVGPNKMAFVHQYNINASVANPGSIAPYKQTSVTYPAAQTLGFCAWSPDETLFLFSTTDFFFTAFYEVYVVPTANDAVQQSLLCNVTVPVLSSLRRWTSLLAPTLTGGIARFIDYDTRTQVHFTVPNSPSTVSGTQTVLPDTRRFAQRGNVQVVGTGTTVSINGIVVGTPFAANWVTDVFYVTMDQASVDVIASDGRFYQYDVGSATWITNDDLDLFQGDAPVSVNEKQLGYDEWFLGTTFSAAPQVPVITTFPTDLLLSLHQLFLLRATSYNATTNRLLGTVFEVNVYELITSGNYTTRLYDNGVIQVVDTTSSNEVWNSHTDDQEGANDSFNILDLVVSYTTQALYAVSSPNGRYLLLVLEESVDLVFNPFNMPRFTSYAENSLQQAVDGQSFFCFSALNDEEQNPVKFVDGHCTCLVSDRLLGRVFPGSDTLDLVTRFTLKQRIPCVMQDCQEALAAQEWTIASLEVGDRCEESVGICSSYSPGVENVIVTQNCGINTRPCVDSSHCPIGANCRNGQCLQSCSNDVTCSNANPFAKCVGGQCEVVSTPPPSSPLTLNAILAIVFGAILLILLCLLVYYWTKRAHAI